MANTLTGLVPTLYEALNVVSREMVGMIPAVQRDTMAGRAAKDQTVRVPIVPAGTAEDITPGINPADSGDNVMSYADVVITKSRAVPIRWNGEEQVSVGSSYTPIFRDQAAEAMRTLVNEVEVDLAAAGKEGASRAYGTAGTTPFATAGNLTDVANIGKILDDNGCPKGDRQLALSSASWVNLRGKQSGLYEVNRAGSSDLLRDGWTSRLQGFDLRDSAGLTLHTKGTGTLYVSNAGTTEAIGETVMAADGGSGTIIAGDIITQADDSVNKYVVTSALSGGSFTIGKPGLIDVDVDDGDAFTVGASYTPNLAFSRSAIVLVTRAPALPEGGDSADDRTLLTDPVTGLTFEVAVYRQYRQVKYEVSLAWGAKAVKNEHIAILLG